MKAKKESKKLLSLPIHGMYRFMTQVELRQRLDFVMTHVPRTKATYKRYFKTLNIVCSELGTYFMSGITLKTRSHIVAKWQSIVVWTHLSESGLLKKNLPEWLFIEIEVMRDWCPLCSVVKGLTFSDCPKCPLKSCSGDSYFDMWQEAENEIDRKICALKILIKIKAWEIKGEKA